MKVAGSCSDQLGIGTEPLQEKRGGGLFGPHFGQAAIPSCPLSKPGGGAAAGTAHPGGPLQGTLRGQAWEKAGGCRQASLRRVGETPALPLFTG